jgi:hypothetical protein
MYKIRRTPKREKRRRRKRRSKKFQNLAGTGEI